MKSPDEIWKIEKINGLEIINFYFEKVLLPYFTAIITEQAIILPIDIPKYLYQIHPIFPQCSNRLEYNNTTIRYC